MTFQQEFNSWLSPASLDIASTPKVGSKAPKSPKLQLSTGEVAEKAFKLLRDQASEFPEVNYVAVSHSSPESTQKWAASIGGSGSIKMIVDSERSLYAQWGLGVGSAWHVLNPFSMWSVYKLGRAENIWNRPTESGNRWQTSGTFAVDKDGVVRWSKVAVAADDIPDFQEALRMLGASASDNMIDGNLNG